MKTGYPITKLNNIEVCVCLGAEGMCLDYNISLCMFKQWGEWQLQETRVNIEWGMGWTVLGLSQAFSPSVLARVTSEQPSAMRKGTAKVHRPPSPASLKHDKWQRAPEKQLSMLNCWDQREQKALQRDFNPRD